MPNPAITELRDELQRQGLDGFIVPRADEHLGEYVPPAAERLRWLTGFSGSAGLAVVLGQLAAVFTDGRYVLQLAAETDGSLWQRCHITETPPQLWIAANVPAGARIGYDPLLISETGLQAYLDAGLVMVATEHNPVDAVWHDRPPSPLAPAVAHGPALAGTASRDKREAVAATLRAAGHQAAVLTDPASIAWLLNIRGADVPFTPFALGFAVLHDDATCDLFMAPEKLSPDMRAWLGNDVAVADRAAMPATLSALHGKRVRVDGAGTPAWFPQTLRAAGAEVILAVDPCLLPKACKNATEQAGARTAHARDAIAMCRFLHWLDSAAGHATEMSAAAQLLAFRAETEDFRGESFPAISGAGEHGAIIHYRVSPATDRAIKPNEVYLIDSGAQFGCGTTDITRTIWTGPDLPPIALRDRVTRVMQGHIAIATLVFPQGVAGSHLDAFARAGLWQVGLDYDHGTGHGVGSYLSVHEGPAGLSRAARPVPIETGMILSNEPGFYLPGHYGIRLENLLLVQPAALPEATKPFLRFETLSLAPFDTRLLNPAMLSHAERTWLDTYHARVLDTVGPYVPAEVRDWLALACAALPG
jgi:Xaa-Pro aminopeptidase